VNLLTSFVPFFVCPLVSIHYLAGGQYVTMAEHLVPKGFDAVVKNNLSGTWNFIYHVATLAFIPQKDGTIVNIIAQIKRGFPGMLHTGAARAGVANLTKTLAVEWSKYGIRTNAIAPGVIESTGTTKYTPEFLEAAKKSAPIKRLGTTQEVTHLACFLASKKAASFITGQTYYVDGGQSLGREMWSLPSAKL
jgi:citronellol/citronellal dehydrogenase